jgi:hypothetical protein
MRHANDYSHAYTRRLRPLGAAVGTETACARAKTAVGNKQSSADVTLSNQFIYSTVDVLLINARSPSHPLPLRPGP